MKTIDLDIQRYLGGEWLSVWRGVVAPQPGSKEVIDPGMDCSVRVVVGVVEVGEDD